MSTPPAPLALLRHATLADGSRVDVVIDGPVVAELLPAGAAEPHGDPASVLDLEGFVLLTAPAEPHAHLDKARSWDAIRPPMGDLELAIRSWHRYAETMTVEDVAARARGQLLRMLAHGTTSVRSHVDVLLGDAPTRGVEALVRVREELRGLVELEIVALAGWEASDAALEAVLDAGADAVGGAPHLAPDPLADLRRLVAVAERRGLPIDLHTDESITGQATLGEYARLVAGFEQNVSAGHCVRLGTVPAAQRALLVEAVVASRIGIIANPITNLYLQGWGEDVATPRGLAPARALLDAGARFAAGADNVRDPFNPLGRSDALETAMLLVAAAHLSVEEAYAAVSDGAREVMGLPAAGPVPGARAELLAIEASSLAEAVADAPADRLVIHEGRLVAVTSSETMIAAPAAADRRGPAPLLSPTGTR